ncbi:MAG: glutaredoxin family protein [Deltaproteobacteria bacterium]|nr:glutaredoxin family protein [Deltaproteobacteria bacterium]
MTDVPRVLVLWTTPGCGPCEEALEALRRVQARVAFTLDVRGLLSAPADFRLRHRYDIPLLLEGDRVLCRHRVDEQGLERLLRGTPVAD